MSDQVGNPEDRFSHNEAHFISEMTLTLSILFCYCLVICNVMSALPRSPQQIYTLEERDDDVNDRIHSSRVRRTMPNIITTILQTAWIRFSSKNYIQYAKRGNYKDARKDFRKLNPNNVENDGPVLRGRLGEAFLELHDYPKRGHTKAQVADIKIFMKGNNNNVEQLTIHYFPKH